MAKRSDRSSNSSASGSGRRRTPVSPTKKPFPWGTVAISAVLGLLLVGILVYAVTNQGSGFVDPLKAADKSVQGVSVSNKEARTHTEAAVKYEQRPPVGGAHNPIPQTCQVYTQPLADEHVVHSLEHGAVWVTYRPDLPANQIATLASLVQGNPYRILSPYPGLKKPISLQAWGRQVFADKPTDKQVGEFLDAYTSGPQAPERGAACSGTTDPGPLQTAPAPAPSP
ncbi:MAG: DUF3105 domain-containing protein [Mycobacteriales bacterium]